MSKDNLITECEVKSISLDQCEKCRESFVISGDGLKCFSKLNNCIEHTKVPASANIECLDCREGYFITENKNC